MTGARTLLKHGLARAPRLGPARGVTILTYHRVGGNSDDELDVDPATFERQLDLLRDHEVVHLDAALDGLDHGDTGHRIVLTFDDGFSELATNALPLLRARQLPFTLYLATAYVGATMRWPGSTAHAFGTGLTWGQIDELVASGLCTIGNHTHHHVRPEHLTVEELDRCDAIIDARTGSRTRHFAYPWGVPVPTLEPELRRRFRSCVTGAIGRNGPGQDRARLRRVPVRRTDPLGFFAAKLEGPLVAERTYDVAVRAAKRLRPAS